MEEHRFRNKITWFTFGFSLFVVWIHSYNAELYLGKTPEMAVIYRIEHLIGDGIGQMAVPGFFMISAYLFYRNFSWDKLMEKWNSRIKSILVPFIVWNFLYYLGYVIGSRLPWMTEVMGKGVIPFRLTILVDAIIHYTYNYVFWYLYQLILLILLTPLLYPVLKHRVAGLCLQAAVWVLMLLGVTLPELNLDALAYYSFAAYLAIHAKELVEGSWTRRRGLWGILLLAVSMLTYRYGLVKAETAFFALCRLLGVSGLWLVVSEVMLPEAKSWMNYNFFLYATHFAFVRFINKAGVRILPAAPVVPFLLYLTMPVLVLVISTGIGAVLRRYAPVLWGMLNGGR